MKKELQHKFVEYIPEEPEDGILYISVQYKTAVHLCACGCGNKVVTPITPNDWEMSFNGVGVSLDPSIGNWNFPCKSHYFITRNKIDVMSKWSEKRIKYGQQNESERKKNYYEKRKKD